MPSDTSVPTEQIYRTETQVVTFFDKSLDKRGLLKESVGRIVSRRDEAKLLLQRITQLNPEIGEQLELKEDVLSRLKLRIIFGPDADVHTPEAGSVQSYIALSYCWHNEYWEVAKAARPTTEWGLSKPIVEKILTLRISKDEGVWVDRICIDQEDDEEKVIAIGSMDIIYRSSRRLVIALEDIQLTKDEDSLCDKYIQRANSMIAEIKAAGLEGAEKSCFIDWYWTLDESDMTALEDLLMKLLGARWFTRAWCAHEISVKKHDPKRENKAMFLCFGADGRVVEIEFQHLHLLAASVGTKMWQETPANESEILATVAGLTDNSCPDLFTRVYRLDRLAVKVPEPGEEDKKSSLLYHWSAIAGFGCQEVRDLCAIAWNRTGLPLVFKGTLSSLDEIHHISSLVAIASGDTFPLFAQMKPVELQGPNGKIFLTWCGRPFGITQDQRFESEELGSIHSVTAEYIELDLLLIKGRPLPISPQAWAEACYIIDHYYPAKRKAPNLPAQWSPETEKLVSMSNHQLERFALGFNFPQTILAAAIDCGLPWIRKFAIRLMFESVTGKWSNGAVKSFDPDFCPAAIELLGYFGRTETNTHDWNACRLDVLRFFSCINDDRMHLLHKVPRRIATGTCDKFGLTGRTSNRAWFAIPVALAHLEFWHNKVWLIEPYNPDTQEREIVPLQPKSTLTLSDESEADVYPLLYSDKPDRRKEPNEHGTWQLRTKNLIYGCEPIAADGETVLLLKKQRVYGGEDFDWAASIRDIGNDGEHLEKALKDKIGEEEAFKLLEKFQIGK
jgi:hypothetical protein